MPDRNATSASAADSADILRAFAPDPAVVAPSLWPPGANAGTASSSPPFHEGDDIRQLEATDPTLHYFRYEHLPDHLQARSKPFGELARHVVRTTPAGSQRNWCLMMLLVAKDAAVRAVIVP